MTDRPRKEFTSTQRGYSSIWQRFRRRYLRENPLCVYCKREGKIEAATVVDHIKPHKGDKRLFWDMNNLQPLCTTHHQRTKQIEENAYHKPEIGDDGWPKV